ncbi:MAG: hypothetical protein U1F55_11765 [Chitinivorax sp.]
MNTNTILLWAGLMALTATPAQAEDAMYLHTHKGTQAQAQNTDTNFGSPAEYNSYNRYRRNYEILLSANGVDSPGKLTVERRAVANFEARNTSDKELVLLIGDDRAIAESTQLIAAGGNAAALDFHARKLQPGQILQFGWRFDTYATQQVKFAVITTDGKPATKTLTIQVGPLEDRNYRMAGQ